MKTLTLAFALAAVSAASLPVMAATQTFRGTLAPEAAGATGTGLVTVVYDDVAHTLDIDASFSGLSGLTNVAHIHCCTAAPGTGPAGVAVTTPTLPGFPVGASAGSYSALIDLTLPGSFGAAFVTASGGTLEAAEARLISKMGEGLAYFNVHTLPQFSGGEIRTFLAPIPEPSTYALMALGLAAVGAAARRRRA